MGSTKCQKVTHGRILVMVPAEFGIAATPSPTQVMSLIINVTYATTGYGLKGRFIATSGRAYGHVIA